jgi:hypothetical protein
MHCSPQHDQLFSIYTIRHKRAENAALIDAKRDVHNNQSYVTLGSGHVSLPYSGLNIFLQKL